MNGGAASSDESEDSGSGAEMEQLNLEAVAVKQQMMDYGRVFVVGIPVKKFRRCVCLVRNNVFWGVCDNKQKRHEDKKKLKILKPASFLFLNVLKMFFVTLDLFI